MKRRSNMNWNLIVMIQEILHLASIPSSLDLEW
uniref:Uncharacterized protein n=1 Tax=Podoviridae sp. ctuQh21 TaxID=2825284 RepID=A0A8S5PFZ3_9CAUD|nr:MAG TPA: hypothetical protein [Podoviridae sp. ctuQh21]